MHMLNESGLSQNREYYNNQEVDFLETQEKIKHSNVLNMLQHNG